MNKSELLEIIAHELNFKDGPGGDALEVLVEGETIRVINTDSQNTKTEYVIQITAVKTEYDL